MNTTDAFRTPAPAEFYRAQLAANKVVASPEDLSKFAADRNIPIHVAKLAKLYFEQLALDGVRYPSEEARQDDAIKMAAAYFEQAGDIVKSAVTIADRALEKIATVAAEMLKSEGLTGVTVAELLKVASLQQSSKEDYERVETLKVATAQVAIRTKIKISDAKLAAVSFLPVQSTEFYTGEIALANLRPDAAQKLANLAGYTGADATQLLHQNMGLAATDPLLQEHLHGILSLGFKTAGSTLESATAAYQATPPAPSTWLGRNANWAVPTAVLGGGAAYLLHRNAKDKDEAQKRQLLEMVGRHAGAQT